MIEVVFFDGRFRPDRVQQFLLRHEPPGILDQHAERVEDLQPQRDHFRAARETAFPDVELKRPKPIGDSDPGIGHESHLRKVSERRQGS